MQTLGTEACACPRGNASARKCAARFGECARQPHGDCRPCLAVLSSAHGGRPRDASLVRSVATPCRRVGPTGVLLGAPMLVRQRSHTTCAQGASPFFALLLAARSPIHKSRAARMWRLREGVSGLGTHRVLKPTASCQTQPQWADAAPLRHVPWRPWPRTVARPSGSQNPGGIHRQASYATVKRRIDIKSSKRTRCPHVEDTCCQHTHGGSARGPHNDGESIC